MSNLEEIVLNYPKLKERINGRKAETEKALRNLEEIKAEFSYNTIAGFEKFLDQTMARLYDGFNWSVPDGMDFKELCQNNNVVLVPNHQSHADYLAVNYMVFKKYDFPLYIAGGINLNVFPIGTLFRKSGCFFIRRSFASDILYKLTLEAYLYYLLMTGKSIEFFFEGGRSRSGKLRPPRFGLYQMLLDAHNAIPEEKRRKLLFIPMSIVHEFVPEQKALSQELDGKKKKKESFLQLFNLFKLISLQFGNVHMKLGHPVEAPKFSETRSQKELTQDLAFKCFRRVGKNMIVTPTSLLSLILLDEPSGAMKWKDIISRTRVIVHFCKKFKVPLSPALESEDIGETMGRAIDILLGNNKIDIIGKTSVGHVFYSIKKEARNELLYHKNTIVHHFLVPWTINSVWINIFNGSITNMEGVKKRFLYERNQLKQEFYLPTVKEFLFYALDIISGAVGKNIPDLEECLNLSNKEIYKVASFVGVFSRAGSYIYEAYYLSALALLSLVNEKEKFSFDDFEKKFNEIFELELNSGRIIKYPESCSKSLMKSSLKYYSHLKVIGNEGGTYFIEDKEKLTELIKQKENDLIDKLTFNVSAQLPQEADYPERNSSFAEA